MIENKDSKDERKNLVTEICLFLESRGISTKDIKNEIYIVINKYDVKKEVTDVVIYEGDINDRLLKRFIASKTIQGCTKRTLELYQYDMQKFIDFINKPLTDTTADDIRYYTATLLMSGRMCKTSAGNHQRVLSAFFGWMFKEEITQRNVMNKVERLKKEKKTKKAFTEVDIEKIRDGCVSERDRCLIEVLLSTWCRISEVENMKISDIKSDGSMTVFGKGEKERTVYLNAKAQFQIEKYLAVRKDDKDWLFVTNDRPYDQWRKSGMEETVRKIGRKQGVDNVHPHRFRRTGATFALRAGMPIEDVSRILGHEDLSTTQIYLDMDDTRTHASHEKYSK